MVCRFFIQIRPGLHCKPLVWLSSAYERQLGADGTLLLDAKRLTALVRCYDLHLWWTPELWNVLMGEELGWSASTWVEYLPLFTWAVDAEIRPVSQDGPNKWSNTIFKINKYIYGTLKPKLDIRYENNLDNDKEGYHMKI